MKKQILWAAALAIPFTVFAQQPQGEGRPGGGPGGRPDAEKMRQMFEERFKKADLDGDGALTKAEAEKGMPMLARDFDKIDTNKDGKLTQDEIRAAMERRRADMAGKGGPGGERGPGREGGRPSAEDMKARGEEMFKKADTNGDGVLTEDEAARASPRLAQNFTAMDANRDGKLTREEISQYRESRRKEWESKRGEKQK